MREGHEVPASVPGVVSDSTPLEPTAPRDSKVATAWKWLASNKDSFTVVFAVAAGLTTLVQYRLSVEDGRRKESLKYVERSQDSRVGQARGAIAEVFLDALLRAEYDTSLRAALATPPDLQPLDDFVNKQKLKGPIIILIEHYMNLAGCVKAGVCDKEVACDFFKSDIEALNNSFRPVFEQIWLKTDGQNYMLMPVQFAASCPLIKPNE